MVQVTTRTGISAAAGGACATALVLGLLLCGTLAEAAQKSRLGGATLVTSAHHVILPTDTEVTVNYPGAVTLILPGAAAWLSAHKGTASPLTIRDTSGAAAANNITIKRAGSDTINEFDDLVITADFGGFKLRPRSSIGNWVIE